MDIAIVQTRVSYDVAICMMLSSFQKKLIVDFLVNPDTCMYLRLYVS
jgi:hypothetical protein